MPKLTKIYDEKNPDATTYAVHADDGHMIGELQKRGSQGWEIFSRHVGPIELIPTRTEAIKIMHDSYQPAGKAA